jgi:hypothetical protein
MRWGWHFYVINSGQSGAIIGLAAKAQCDASPEFTYSAQVGKENFK